MNLVALLLFLQFGFLQFGFLQLAHPQQPASSTHPAKPAPATPAVAENEGIFGTWMARDRSLFNIFPCGVTNGQGGDPKEACVRLLEGPHRTDPDAPDAENPDPQKRDRPLRDAIVGKFVVTDPDHPERAGHGKLYDPDNGHSYSGTLTATGNTLKLHGTRFLFFGHTITCRRIELAKPSPYHTRR